MESLVFGELTIEAKAPPDGAAIDLYWRGRSLDRHPSPTILPYVADVLAEAAKRSVPLRMHFETVELVNSSTITAVIHVIREARTRGAQLHILYDPSMDWQRLSFEALGVLLQGDERLKLIGAPTG